MATQYCIPDREYRDRIRKFQANIRKAGLDAALVHSNEGDFANVRYLSEYWPTFEAAGVFVPKEGQPILIIGPESETYAKGRSKIDITCEPGGTYDALLPEKARKPITRRAWMKAGIVPVRSPATTRSSSRSAASATALCTVPAMV